MDPDVPDYPDGGSMNEKIEAARARVIAAAKLQAAGQPNDLLRAVHTLVAAEYEGGSRYHYDATSHGTGFMEGSRHLLAGDVLALLNAERTPPRAPPRYSAHSRADMSAVQDRTTGRVLSGPEVLALLNAEAPPRANWEADGTLLNEDGCTKLSVIYWDTDAAAGEMLARKAASLIAAALNKERTP